MVLVVRSAWSPASEISFKNSLLVTPKGKMWILIVSRHGCQLSTTWRPHLVLSVNKLYIHDIGIPLTYGTSTYIYIQNSKLGPLWSVMGPERNFLSLSGNISKIIRTGMESFPKSKRNGNGTANFCQFSFLSGKISFPFFGAKLNDLEEKTQGLATKIELFSAV